MAIIISKLPKWNESKTEDKLFLIHNFICIMAISMLCMGIVIMIFLIFISDILLEELSIIPMCFFSIMFILLSLFNIFISTFRIKKE